MKIKIRSDDASTLRKDGWPQTGDWPAELRDDSRTEPPGDGQSKADGADVPRSGALAQADALTEARARAHADAQARAQADARAQARAHAEADACAGAIGRAVIGDQLRIPIMWCDMGSCISVHADPASLGEADARARAISVPGASRPTPRSGPPSRSCRGTGTWPSPGPPGPPCPATVPPTASPGERAITRAVLPAAIPRPAGRSASGTTMPRILMPCPLADTLRTKPVP
jgi:hypothetical protein